VTHLPFSSRHEFDALLVIVDRFSKRVWLIPTWGTATAEVTAMLFLKHIIYENGIAIEIVFVFIEIILAVVIEIDCHRNLENLREARAIAATRFTP
jgi:hypothetical protein